MDDPRYMRTVVKDIGLSAQDLQEICRILRNDDYTSPFPLTGHITYAKAIVLINIIEDCGLTLTSTLPVALSLVDKNLPPVVAPRPLKRACQRRIKSGKDLNEQIDSLYQNNGDSLGPFCDKIGIGRQWLEDQHDQNIAPGTVIVNGVVLELYQHVKKSEHLNWRNAQRWLSRLFPDQTMSSPKTIQNNWKRLQNKNNVQKNAASRQKLMECTYKKAKRSNPQASTAPFPGGDIVGKEIKHKYEVITRTRNKTTKWYKGTVLRRANEDELVDASPEDMILVEQGYSIFMVHYEKHEHAEPICLEVDWNNGDIKLA